MRAANIPILLLLLHTCLLCVTAFDTVTYRAASSGTSSGARPSVGIDTVNSKVLIATQNGADDSKPWVFICDLDGRGCSGHDASNGQGVGSGYSPSLAIDTANSRVLVATRNSNQLNKPWLFICNLNGTDCSDHDVSNGQGTDSGRDPSLAIDTANSRVLIATQNNAQSGKPWLYICNLDGSACFDYDISSGEGVDSGMCPSLAVDTVNSKVLVATQNRPRSNRPWLFICNLDGSACSDHDMSGGRTNYGNAPSLAIDTINSKAIVATWSIADNSRPWLHICNLDGSACSSHNASATQGALSGLAPSLAIDPVTAKVLIATRNSGQSNKAWLFVCNLNGTGCTDLDASGDQLYFPLNIPSLVVSSPLAYLAAPATASGTLALNLISPAVPLRCPSVIPNGNLTLEFNYPLWEFSVDASTCFPGYALVGGATTGTCFPGATSWSTTVPLCVFNASALFVQFTSLTIQANELLFFRLTDAGGRAGIDPGPSSPTVLLDALPVDSLVFSYLNGNFDSQFRVPTRAGFYTYSIYLDGVFVSSAQVEVVPNAFDGFVTSMSMSNTTGVLTAPFERPTLLHLTIQDTFGNGLVADEDGIRGAITVALVSGESTTPLTPTPVTRVGDEPHVDALYTVRPLILGESALRVAYVGTGLSTGIPCLCGGTFATRSPFPVEVVCPPGLQETGATCVATPCNENSVNVAPAGVNIPECVCDTGFTFAELDNNSIPICGSCPEGGVCARGLGPPVAAPGFYPVPDGTFVRCKRKTACSGGTSPCARGYEGYMCNTCEDDFYSNSAGDCAACPGAAGGIFAGALVVLVTVGVGLAVVVALGVVSATKSTGDEGGSGLRARQLPASFAMILSALQYVGLVASANFGWSDSAQRTLNVANVANVDVNLFASECALDSFHIKYATSIGLPLLLIVLALAALIVFKVVGVLGMGKVGVGALVDSVVFTVAPLVYTPMARATFVVFDCSRLPNGDFVLDVDPGVACFDGAWWRVAWIGMVSVAGFVVGVPAYFFVCVYRRRTQLMDPVTFARYGALYRLYRVPYFGGGVADLAKRLSIVLASVFVSEHVLALLGLLLMVFLASSYAVNSLHPYYYPLYNTLDFRLSLVLIVLLLLGGGSYAERNTQGSMDTVFLVGIVLTLVVFAGVGLHAVVVDVYQILQARQSKYSAVDDRMRRAVRVLERESLDFDAEHARRTDTFVSSFAGQTGPRDTTRDTIALQDINAIDHLSSDDS